MDEPDTGSQSQSGELLPIYVGGGGDNLLCGECFLMVAQFVELENLRGRKLICPRCARENVIPMVGDLRALGQESATQYDSFSQAATRPGLDPTNPALDSGRPGVGEGSVVTT